MLEIIQSIKNKINKLIFLLFYKSSFKNFGSKSTICMPFQIDGARFIKIGKKVHVQTNSWMLALKTSSVKPEININDGVYIGRFAHIVSTNSICIEKNVLISDKVLFPRLPPQSRYSKFVLLEIFNSVNWLLEHLRYFKLLNFRFFDTLAKARNSNDFL